VRWSGQQKEKENENENGERTGKEENETKL
jgi:hypothetical protein